MTPTNVKQYIDMIVQALTPLGEAAKQGFNQYLALAVRQKHINGIEELIVAGLLLVVTAILFDLGAKAVQHYRKETSEYRKDTDDIVGYFTCACLLLAITLFFTFNGIDNLVNPQYFVIKDIIDAAKG